VVREKLVVRENMLGVTVLVLVLEVLGTFVWSSSASAQPTLTQDETTFVTKLAKGDPLREVAPILPAPGRSAWDLAQMGHLVADDVRHGVHPLDEQAAIERTPGSGRLTSKQWSFVVVAAVWTFAPDFGQSVVRSGKCRRHLAQADRMRGTSKQRGYDREHRENFRAPVLARDNHTCVLCGDVATHADHYPRTRKQLVAEGLDANDPQYGRALCESCHRQHTAATSPGFGGKSRQ